MVTYSYDRGVNIPQHFPHKRRELKNYAREEFTQLNSSHAGNACGGHGQCVMAASIDICDYQDAAKRKRCEQDHIRCACDDGWKGKVCETEALTKKEKRASKKAFVALVMLLTALTVVSVCLSVYASRSQRRIANYERILAEGGQLGDAGRFEAPVPDEVPKSEMRKVGDARVSPLHYGDVAAEGV